MKQTATKASIFLSFLLFSSFITTTSYSQTTYYWVGNSGDWKDLSHWSLSSGGTPVASTPTLLDDVIFDANSFTLPGQLVTINDDGSDFGVSFKTMDWRGVTNMPTFRIRATTSQWIANEVGGSLYFDQNMIIDFHMAEFYFGSNANYDLDTKGHNLGLNCFLSVNLPYGGGGYAVTCNLLSDLNHMLLYVDKGTFNSNGFEVNGQAIDAAAANYMWIRNSSVADFSNSVITAGHLNITESGSIVDDNSHITVSQELSGSSLDFNHVAIIDTVIMSGATTGNITFQTLELLPASVFSLKENSTQTVVNLIANGLEEDPITIKSTVDGITANLNKTSGVAEIHYAHIKDISAIGGATFKAYNSWNDGNVSGITFVVHDSDSLALVDLYNSTNGASWVNNTGWLTDNVANWFGVVVADGRVRNINLADNNLEGNISPSIGDLTALQDLTLPNNKLTGALPDEIGNLKMLAGINLDNNNMTGLIPASIGTLSSLTYLSLGGNDFGGSIPPAIGNLPSLETIYLWGNNFSGSIPVELTQPPLLREIGLSGNQLTGDVPEEFNNMGELELLDIGANRLSGLPNLTGMDSIIILNVTDNYFTFEDIAPNVSIAGINFNYQKDIQQGDTIEVTEGSNFELTASVGGTGNVYQWKKAFTNVGGATATTYSVSSASGSDAGIYFLEISNPSVPGLTLRTTNYLVDVISANASEESGYSFLKKLGAETLGLFEHHPLRLVAGSTGVTYVQDAISGNINKFSSNGDFLLSINNGYNISDIETDGSDALYLSDEVSSTVRKFNASGALQMEIPNTNGTYGMALDLSGNIVTCPRNSPDRFKIYNGSTGAFISDVMFSGAPSPGIYLDIEIDNAGYFYAMEASIPRLDKYSPGGTFIQSFDLVSAGLLAWIGWDFEVDTNGDVFILNGTKVHRFNSGGSFLNQFGSIEGVQASSVSFTGSNIMVSEGNNGISIYDATGAFIESFGPQMNADGQFNAPSLIAIDNNGFRYVADTYNHRVQKLTANGDFVAVIGSKGSGAAELLYPVHIAVDASGNLYVSDQGNNRIQKYASNGTHLLSIGGPGTADGQLVTPKGIAISKRGFLFVADAGNNRIQKFTTDGVHVLTFGTAGSGDGLINSLHALHVQGDGTLVASNNYPTRIMRFDEEGSLLGEIKMGDYRITSISSDSDGALYICANGTDVPGDHAVRKINASGAILTRIGTPGSSDGTPGNADGELDGAYAVSSNATGDTVWVSAFPNRISIFYSNFRKASAADSLVLVELYDATNGSSWTNNTNWLSGNVDTWYGISVSGGEIRKIELPENNLQGTIPSSISDLNELNVIDLSGNQLSGNIPAISSITSLQKLVLSENSLTDTIPALPAQLADLQLANNQLTSLSAVPDFVVSADVSFNNLVKLGDLTNSAFLSLDVRENNLTFEDLEPNSTITGFQYTPQDTIGSEIKVVRNLGASVTFESATGGTANQYQWFKNGEEIDGATGASFLLEDLQLDDDALYNVHVTNTVVTGLTLKSFNTDLRVSSLLRDSLALVELYNRTNGPGWVNNTGWTESTLETWEGIAMSDGRVTGINLAGNNLQGELPSDLTDMLSLTSLGLPDNHLTSIPDLSSLSALTTINVSGNKLDFQSLIPNANINGIDYSNQQPIGVDLDTLIDVGSDYKLKVITRGEGNAYVWKHNGALVEGAIDTTYTIHAINRSNMGEYVAEVTNPQVAGLTLTSGIQRVLATADVSGKFMLDETNPVTVGEITLFRVTNQNGYDTISSVTVGEDGKYLFEKVVLDDYQLLGFADTLTYEDALPTYYKNTIFWEEADTLVLTTHVDTIDIVSIQKPSPPSGHGAISGYLEEDDGTGGRIKDVLKTKRVSSAGVSVRRVQNAGRGKDVKLTLVAYVFTDEEGLFNITNLPEDDYLLNIQYPGYPMDTATDIRITIGSGIAATASVAANVIDGKIKVHNRPVTGVQNIEAYSVQAYPNPARGSLHLKFARENAGRTIEMLDLTGKCVLRSPAGGIHEIISLQQTPKGLYLLNVREKAKIVRTIKVAITE